MDSNLENPSKDEEDRLSSFPESILTHILSFVPTKCAARTSILSKRWKFRFLCVPKLVFDEEMLSSDHGTFIDFVNRRLLLCIDHTSIAEFRLKLPKLPQLSVINLWILTLLFRNLKVLKIEELGDSDSTATPQCPPSEIFGWETLEVLKLLGRKMVLKFPRSVIFPKLKVLDLEYLEMHSESESLSFDQQGYPLLEKLRLRLVRFNCSKDIDDKAFLGLLIFLCNLKTLEFAFKKPKLAKIDIDAPQLRQLNYDIWEVDNVSQVQLTFRKSEFLMFAALYSEFNPHDLHIEVLSKMSGVKDLNLYFLDARDLPYPLPHFANLTHLYLYQTGVESMLSVLRNAPKLEVLVHQKSDRDEGFASPIDVPLCLARELKQVRINKFESCESEVKLVSYFLQHGAVLESVTLENSEWSVSTLEELLNLPRCSPKCKIVLDKESGN